MTARRAAREPGLWSTPRFALALAALTAAGLGLAALLVQGGGALPAAAAGASFGCGAGIAGYAVVARAASRSIGKGVQVFLAVMTVKMLAFAAFLLTISLVTPLDPVALAGGLVGTTLAAEALAIASLRRLQEPDPGGPEQGLTPSAAGGPARTSDSESDPTRTDPR